MRRIALVGAFLGLAILAVIEISATTDDGPGSKSLTVHEWGTFTSVAGPSGEAVAWLPFENPAAQSDLPCFVYGEQLVPCKSNRSPATFLAPLWGGWK
jgi:hypothetical protein